jgi:hypothetical protein
MGLTPSPKKFRGRWIMRLLSLAMVCVSCTKQPDQFEDGADISQSKANAMSNEVVIKLGEMGPQFLARYPKLAKVQHQPAGLDFYEINWNERPRGLVRLAHAKHSMVIADVLGVQAVQELGPLESEGLNAIRVFAGLSQPPPSLIGHDEARVKIHAILKVILEAGWKNILDAGSPRLNGLDRMKYMWTSNKYVGLDATYLPTLDEWMRIESRTSWGFYADGVFLEVSFTRERTMTDLAKPGSYLLNFEFKTATEYFRGYANSEDRLRWREVVPNELAKIAAQRTAKEVELKAKGVRIDEDYRDPPMPAMN